MANGLIIAVVVIYMLVMLYIGYASSKKVNSNEDFVVAGRRLGPFLMMGTLAATEIGGGSSLGVVQNGMNAKFGISASWYIITMGLAFVILTFIAPKLRETEVKTVPEFFRRKYGKVSGIITSVIMFLPLVGLTAGQFIAYAYILATMLGISYKMAVIIVGVVVTVYAVMGGMWSVTITDFVQVFLIVIGMALALPSAIGYAGGWTNVKANVPADTWNMFKGYSPMAVISLIIMYVGTFTVGQEAVSRYYAAKNGRAAKQGSILAGIVNFVYAFIPTIIGIVMLALINMGKFGTEDFAAVGARYALPVLAVRVMHPIICGLLFAGIISATMSSADSDLLGAGSIFANDIYKQVIKRSANDKQVMYVTRVTMVCVGILALLFSYFNTSNLISILTFCFTLRAAGTFFPYVLGLYWKKSSTAGSVASLVAGTIVVVAMDNCDLLPGLKKFFGGQTIVPGLIIALIAFIAFSYIFPGKREKTLELVEEQ
ncbi:MAG TPA: sodium:solute symporter [Spirochaetaceae bacterium]|nr:sodium:solute symporter [Spirochaetaceae bacterium]